MPDYAYVDIAIKVLGVILAVLGTSIVAWVRSGVKTHVTDKDRTALYNALLDYADDAVRHTDQVYVSDHKGEEGWAANALELSVSRALVLLPKEIKDMALKQYGSEAELAKIVSIFVEGAITTFKVEKLNAVAGKGVYDND